jgi:hypothetical protein
MPHPCEAMVRDHNSPSLTGQVGYALEGGFMNTNDIVLAIDAKISRLQQAKALLTDTFSLTHAKRKPGRPFYYQDPDHNSVELNVDNYGDSWTSGEHLRNSPEFAKTPMGHYVDPYCVALLRSPSS